ncbi:MAG: hypothetical protein LBH43_18965 [Treponema sp.]|jgi:hypothetical protein|nr:hypothetical protein [Treponema sp.]
MTRIGGPQNQGNQLKKNLRTAGTQILLYRYDSALFVNIWRSFSVEDICTASKNRGGFTGKYKVVLKTQFSGSGSTLLKNVRAIESGFTLE